MSNLYYVWVGNIMRSILFDSLQDAENRRTELLNQGYRGVWIETVGESK